MFRLDFLRKNRLPKASTLARRGVDEHTHINNCVHDIIDAAADAIISISEKGGTSLKIEISPNKDKSVLNVYHNGLILWCALDVFNENEYNAILNALIKRFQDYEYVVNCELVVDENGAALLEEQHLQVKWSMHE